MFVHRRFEVRLRTPQDIGALVRHRRHESGLAQGELAERSGVSRRWLAALEAGKPGAEIGLVLRVLAALGVELDAVERRPVTGDGVNRDDLLAGYDTDAR